MLTFSIMRHIKFLSLLVVTQLLVGCAPITYGEHNSWGLGLSNGYSEQKGPGELIRVQYQRIGLPADKIETYLLYRCAEIAKREGKPYFALYHDLLAAINDNRSQRIFKTSEIGGASAYAYMLLFDADGPVLKNTNQVLAELESKIQR